MTKVAFAVAAHPDDIEFLMSGTLMLLGEAGFELHYMNLANGSLGTTVYDTNTIVAMRRKEAMAAAESIGAEYHESICADLDIFYDRATLARLASVMRDVAPDILLTHSPVDYMEDHTNTCRLAVTAAFARGMPNFPVTPPQATVMKPSPSIMLNPIRITTPCDNWWCPISMSMSRTAKRTKSPCWPNTSVRNNGWTKARDLIRICRRCETWTPPWVACRAVSSMPKVGGAICISVSGRADDDPLRDVLRPRIVEAEDQSRGPHQ